MHPSRLSLLHLPSQGVAWASSKRSPMSPGRPARPSPGPRPNASRGLSPWSQPPLQIGKGSDSTPHYSNGQRYHDGTAQYAVPGDATYPHGTATKRNANATMREGAAD
eukprot:GHVT01086015.1.p1 GENE.GHVT01086015.1~~GHVT01086015.1.p1  ORF type:complete len:108 (-),score=6.66 GHVT01086015.1:177-500(-)